MNSHTETTFDNANGKSTRLIEFNSNIILVKSYIESAKKRTHMGILLWIAGTIILCAIIADATTLQWKGIPPLIKQALSLAAVSAVAFGVYISITPGVLITNFPQKLQDNLKLKNIGTNRRTVSQLELELQILREDKKEAQGSTNSNVDRNRSSYKEDALIYIEELRNESNFYRRVSNFFQVVIIAGASISTLGAGTSYFVNQISLGVAVASFCIAVASSLTGYFKYKERSFYSQQTADAVEHEIEAFELGVGRYKAIQKDDPNRTQALEIFSQEIHRLRQDQKMREQNLDQPSAKGEEGGN